MAKIPVKDHLSIFLEAEQSLAKRASASLSDETQQVDDTNKGKRQTRQQYG